MSFIESNKPYVVKLYPLEKGEKIMVGDFFLSGKNERLERRDHVGLWEKMDGGKMPHFRISTMRPVEVLGVIKPKKCN